MAASQGAEKPGQSGHLRTEAEGVPLLGVGTVSSHYSNLRPTPITVRSFLFSLWQFKQETISISNCLAFVSVSLCVFLSTVYLLIIHLPLYYLSCHLSVCLCL